MSETYNLYNLEAPFEEYLVAGNQKAVSVKNYLSDVRHFFGWLISTGEETSPLQETITVKTISEYKSYLESNNIPHKTINRRLSTLRKFCSFCISQGWMKENPAKKVGNVGLINKAPEGLKLNELSPASGGTKLKSLFKNVFNRLIPIKSGDKKLNTDSTGSTDSIRLHPIVSDLTGFGFQQYIALIIILIFISVMGAGIYNQFFVTNNQSLAYPTALTKAGRILSFQGRLTDTLSNPIITATNVQFRLWKVATVGTEGTCTSQAGEDCLYTTGVCSVTPDSDGIFNSLIGSSCGSEIVASVFTENANVYLGVTVGGDAEMTPRQQIANVGYAINSETLQGLPPGTGTSVIPYINSDGNLLISASAPGIRSTSTSTDFTLSSAKATVIQSAGTGDIVLQATESGTLKFRTGGATDTENRLVIDSTGLDITGNVQFSGALMPNSTAGTTGQFLISSGAGVAPTWTSSIGATSVPFSGITSGTNTTAAMVVGAGATLDYASTGTINASSLIGGTWATPGTIGSTTANTGAFTTVGIGIGTPATTAILDLTSTTKGFLAPRMTTTERDAISTPATGLMIYNTTTNQYNVYNGTTWGAVGGGGGAWSDLVVPTTNLTLAMDADTTTFNWDTLTTGTGWTGASTSLSSGILESLSVNSTAATGNTQKVLSLSTAGANATSTQTTYGLYATNTHTGTTSTNVGGYFSASGGTNNYAAIFANGSVGIGTATPTDTLEVNGGILGSYFLDHSNTAYGIDPANTTAFGNSISMQISGGALMALDEGKVGIGVVSPLEILDVGGNATVSGNLTFYGGARTIAGRSMNNLTIGDSQTGNLILNPGGNVGIGTTDPTTKLEVNGTITTQTGAFSSTVASANGNTAYVLNTTNSLLASTSKLLSVQNNGAEKMYLDANGNLYVTGSVTAGSGFTIASTNKSGGTVAVRSLVILDTANDSSFTTTTTPYNKGAFGVVMGVEVNGDTDSDGACDADEICRIAVGGEVEVLLTNASTASKSDYIYTSATAGSGVASAKQFDGLIGVVSSTAGAGSGYVKMIFKVQPQVTAAASIDKNSKHNEYRILSNDYTSVALGTSPDANIPPRGLTFDNLLDTTKTDFTASTGTTVSGPAQFSNPNVSSFFQTPASPFRVGLVGGQTMSTATTDNAGNTYLGSNTVNDQYLYDRTRDSTAQVQVELGIDPNWYNGVTLSVATSSAQFSQNSVITQPNPNLSTSYNGSLIKVTGTDTTPRTIYITIKSPTTFDWTNYHSSSGTGVTMTPGTAQALGTTGVSVTFTSASYNVGDVFKIASWFIEPTGSTRGTKQQFPERSNIIATASSVDVIDSDTQKLWMRFSQGATALSTDANNDPSSVQMLNGHLYVSLNGSSPMGLMSFAFDHDSMNASQTTGHYTIKAGISQRNSSVWGSYDTYSAPALVSNISNDVSAAVIPNQPTQNVTVSGWGYIVGTGTNTVSETVNLPYKFNSTPTVATSFVGYKNTTAPSGLSECTGITSGITSGDSITTNSFRLQVSEKDALNWGASTYLCYTWTATGQVSPRQYVAVATGTSGADGGASIINETDSSVANVVVGSQHASALRSYKVTFAQDGTLYIASSNETSGNSRIDTYYGAAGLSSETSWAQYINRDYYVNSGYPSILGPAGAGTITSLNVTSGTSMVDAKSNTIYIGTTGGVTVLQEKQSHANMYDEDQYFGGSVKYYTKDYISEEMVGDIRGMWPLSANGALSMSDASVKADTLTNNGSVTAVTGVRGAAASFSGSNYLSCTDAACGGTSKLDASNAYLSVGAWVYPTTIGGGSQYNIITKYDASGSKSYLLRINDATLQFYVSSTGQTPNASTTDITTNKWQYVVGVYDGSTINIYVDGVLKGSSDASSVGVPRDSTASFKIGAIGSGGTDTPTGYFIGYIDEPFVTSHSLTAGQIKNMYQVGYRALQSHATTLGGGAADTNQQLGGTTNVIGAAQPDLNNQFMYVGTNSTTLGALSKIQLNSDTNIKTYNSSANVPTGGTLLIDEDVASLGVGYNLEAVGSAASGVKSMGVDNYSTETTGNYVSKTVTTAESFSQAYIWAQYVLDASDVSNTIVASASNDGGTTYTTCNLTNTDSSQGPTEFEYYCQFNTPGSSLKTKFAFTRGSTKTNTYLTRWGLAWIGSDAIGGAPGGNGLYTNNNASVANGSYIDVAHNQNSNDLVNTGWIYNTATSKWEVIDVKSPPSFTGTGADGDINITSSVNMNAQAIASGRYYSDGIAYKVDMTQAAGNLPHTGNSAILTVDTPSGLNAGDEVLLINLQGASDDTASVGNYEFLRISSISTKTVTFTTNIVNSYKGTTATNQKVVIQRVPNYHNIALSGSGVITASAWDGLTTTPTGNNGYLTGIVAFRAAGTVTVVSGASITASGLGYRLGSAGAASLHGSGGESFCGYSGNGGDNNSDNAAIGTCGGGGGGGAYTSAYNGKSGSSTGGSGGGGGGSTHNSGVNHSTGGGGAGGGYGTLGTGGAGSSSNSGTDGGTNTSGGGGNGVTVGANPNQGGLGGGGGGGGTYGATSLSTMFFGTGGGGGGGQGNVGGGNGANGGGIVFIAANTITNYGTISSGGNNGTAGTTGVGYGNGGGGGGGAGGSIYIAASTATLGSSIVTTSGGTGGAAASEKPAGGNGGVGRVRVEYTTSLSGTTSPAASTSTTIATAAYSTTASPYFIQQVDANTVRLYNYSGSTQNLRLDVITGGLGRNAGTVSLAPAAADVDSQASTNSIWINKTGSGGNLLRLQQGGTDKFIIDSSGSVGVGITTPATTALLDLTSTTKGFLAPRMTTTERDAISTPATGLMIYNTTTNQYNVYNGTSWGAVGGGGESLWTTGTGVIYPVNSTVDLLLGSTASSSAKFAFLNVNSGTPTASVSGSLADVATYLTGDGNLATTNMRTLTLGGSSTGAIQLSPKNTTGLYVDGTGQVGIGTTTPSNELEVNGDVELTNLFDNDASNFFDGGCSSSTSLTGIDSTGAITCTAITGVPASAVSFADITSGTNITAAMVVGAGASLDYTSTGTINASSLIGGTWAAPGTIGSTTPNTGAFTTLSSTGTTTLGDNIADAVTVNAGAWTFANDTNFALTGGLNGLSFDSGTFSVDGLNNRVGIGTTSPDDTLEVNGGILGSYFLDHTNTAYGIDPANTTAFGNSISMQISGGALLALDEGNVGIGNATPIEKLDVTGNATVSGNLTFTGAASTIANRLMQNLTLGDSQTGNIVLANNVTLTTGSVTSSVVDSSTAVGFTLNTASLTTQGAKLLSIQNLGTEKMYLDKDGNLYVSGTLISGNGTSMLLTNKSGGIVANRSVVILDSSNNSSFTTTTTPYSKAGFGVVVGVGLGVTNDANGDGICNADDICMIAYGGSVNVTVKNATTAVKGDYLFTSDTAGSAVASAKQYDGLIGIVNDTTNAASGYLKMIFKVQPQVTAAAAIDKGSKHNEYWLYADQYQAVGEGSNTDTNLLQRGLSFDTFSDSTKVDSTNTTVSFDTNTQKTGLIGGQTMATSTTDNAGNTYLGSNTVNKVFYYDRVKLDSTPQVQVELGIDPNWYNGVTLSVATTSAQFSQNSVVPNQPKNPNLSPTYNGSLVKVTGNYASNAKTIYITIKSPTTFDWTDYNGNSATGTTITPGTAQTLTGTGVSATFSDARYNTGDVFKIASWFVEPTSSTRGGTAKFPERSYIVGEGTTPTLDIIDADTQKLWMRFNYSGNRFLYGSGDVTSTTALNGQIYAARSGNGLTLVDFTIDSGYMTITTGGAYLFPSSISDRNVAQPGLGPLSSSMPLIHATANDVSAAVIPNQPTQNVTVSGWGYITGTTAITHQETVNLPYKFNSQPNISISYNGWSSGSPASLANCTGSQYSGSQTETIGVKSPTTTSFIAEVHATASYDLNAFPICYTWTATGQVSPRQYVAAATNEGVSVINETDSSSISLYFDANWKVMTQVFLTNKDLYFNMNNATNHETLALYGIGGITSSQTGAGIYNQYYYTNTLPPINSSSTVAPTSLYVSQGTSTIDGKSNTLYVGFPNQLTVLQEKQNGGTLQDGRTEGAGSAKFYTKDYISEEMVGDIRLMLPFAGTSNIGSNSLLVSPDSDASVKATSFTSKGSAAMAHVSGVRGNGLNFDGTRYLCSGTVANTCADNDNLDFAAADSFSAGVWIKTTNAVAQEIMMKYNGAAYWDLLMTTNGPVYFRFRDNLANSVSIISPSALNDGNWHHVVGVRNVKTDTSYLYVDGQLVASANDTTTGSMDNAQALGIGVNPNAGNSIFDGSMDEPFVTATALTAGQIKNMYQVGYRALQSHATTLGGGAADTNQQLGGTTNVIGAAQPDLNNQFMYVGTNSTTLGAVSKIDLNSDTNIKTYNSSANVPTGGPLLIDEDTKSLAVGYNLEAVGSAASGVKTMGVDNNATATSGNFIGKTITTAESFTQAYLWAQYTLDASDASNTIEVWASNDGGSNYYQCNVTNTDTSRSPPEYEYFCQFNTAGSSLKTKFVMARGSTKTNTYVSRYGIAWIDADAVAGAANGSGLFTGSDTSVADGGYIEVAHNQNSNDVLTNGWVNSQSTWKQLDGSYKPAIAWEGKDTQRGLYHDQVNLYQPSEETNIYTENLLQSGLLFDTFEDTTKTDSANLTASMSTQKGDDGSANPMTLQSRQQAGRTGLIGGQTFATSTTDNAGNTYLGSNTVNKVFYYDRIKDSVPQVQVELGIDPNWYNGVTLSVATSSASFSQNSVIQKNPNLSTTYNGSLIKVTGTDTTPRTIFITIKSPTTFDWTNYHSSSGTGVTITPGTAQALGTTGVSVTFTSASYNVGDVFKIASWFIEAEGSTRGAKQQFPEKSSLVAHSDGVEVIDADTQKLWMRFDFVNSNSMPGSSGVNATAVQMLNGSLYLSRDGSGGVRTIQYAQDSATRYSSTEKSVWNNSGIATRHDTDANNWKTNNSSIALVNGTANDVSAAVIPNQPTQTVTVSGWGYMAGNGSTTAIEEAVNLPYKFNTIPNVTVSFAGINSSAATATNLSDCNSMADPIDARAKAISINNFTISMQDTRAVSGNTSTTRAYCYTWTATGTVSPKQFVAVATDGGTTIINEADQTAVDITAHANYDDDFVFLTNSGAIYSVMNIATPGTAGALNVFYGIPWSDTTYTSRDVYYYHTGSIPAIPPVSDAITSLYVTEGTSTVDGKSNTVYIGTEDYGLSVLQEVQGPHDNDDGVHQNENSGSVKYYTKDYISEEMVGDIRGMWPLSANGALSMSDASVKAKTLTNNGTATAITGVRGAGVSLNGSTQYLSRASDADLNAYPISVGAWFKTSSATQQTIINKYVASSYNGYSLHLGGTGLLTFYYYNSGSNYVSPVTAGTNYADGNWHYAVAVVDSTSGYIYVDGQLVISNSWSGTAGATTTTQQLEIGRWNATGRYFTGSIDEPFVTATALSAGQIKRMYEVGYRALQSHGTGLGGGSADANQQLGYISTGTNTVGAAIPDWNNQYMYVGTNSTTLGALSKIQLNSDTNIKTYNSSANVPAGGPLLIDEDTKSLAVGYNLEAVGSAASGVKSMGEDNNATLTSGSFVSKTYTLPKAIGSAVIWVSPILDASDASNTLTVKASVDGGSNYATCTLVGTDTFPAVPEKEYACTFAASDNDLKVKFEFARGSTKTNTYVVQYGISWLGETGFKIAQVDANTVRLYNYSGETQNLRLDVITGGLGRNAGTVSLAPAAADVDSQSSTNSLWINKTGSLGNLLKLQADGTDVLTLAKAGTMTLAGNFLPATDNTYDLGASSSARFRELYLGPASLHIQSKSTDAGSTYPALGLDYAVGINTAGSLVTSLNGASNALMTITQGGNVGIGTTGPGARLSIEDTSATQYAARIYQNNATDSFGLLVDAGIDSGDYAVRVRNRALTSDLFAVRGDGNVGIGTTSPSYLFSAAGTGYFASSELITNGTFGSNITGWTDSSGSPSSISWSASNGGSMYFDGNANYARADQSITTIAGVRYTMTLNLKVRGSTGTYPYVYVGTTQGGNNLVSGTMTSADIYNFHFTATGTTTWVRLWTGYTGDYIDDVSIKAVSIITDGNVGIGTISPGGKLDVPAAGARGTFGSRFSNITGYSVASMPTSTVKAGAVAIGYYPGNDTGYVSGDLSTGFYGFVPTGGHGSGGSAAIFDRPDQNIRSVYMGGASVSDNTYVQKTYNTSSGTTLFSISISGYVSMPAGHGDLAENYLVSGKVLRGSLVSIGTTSPSTAVSSSPTHQSLLGVISTKPGAVMDVDGGFQVGADTKAEYNDEKAPIAITGAAPVLVTSQNGPISIGDAIGISTIPGFGAKMITAGQIVGKALEKLDSTSCPAASSVDSIVWPEDDGKNTLKPCFRLPDNTVVGKIMVAVAPTWYDPDIYLTDTGDLEIKNVSQTPYVYDGNLDTQDQILKIKDQSYSLKLKTGEIITRIGAFSEIVAARIKSGFIETENLIVNNTLIAKNIVVDNIQIAGKSINQIVDERIALVLNSQSSTLTSPIGSTDNITVTNEAKINKVTTNEIAPQNQDVVVNLENTDPNAGKLAKLIIKGLEGKTAVVIDAAGNASFSGQIIADSLQINNDASVAGTLIAKEIQSENINSLNSQLANSQTDINDIQKLLADIKNQPIPDANYYQNIDSNVQTQNFASLQTESLTVTGNSNLYNVSVSNSLLVGTTLFDQNSIISLASELKLSALSTINLFDGAVMIARDGKITTRGEIIAQGGIRTDEIKALTDEGQVSIKNLTINNLTIDKISTNSAVIAAADNFAQNGIFAPAIEAATASAGLGILPANQSEVIIYNDRVSADSLVYLTPTSDAPTNSQLTVSKKESCSNDLLINCKTYFKVTGLSSTVQSKFNWLIIN